MSEPAIVANGNWRELRAQVWDRDPEPACVYCGKRLHPFRDFVVDHVVPRSQGGLSELSNLVASCVMCNAVKRNYRVEDGIVNERGGREWKYPGIGRRLAEARVARELTPWALGSLAGLSYQTIISIEHKGDCMPWPKTIRALAAALRVRPHWLRDGTGEMLASDALPMEGGPGMRGMPSVTREDGTDGSV